MRHRIPLSEIKDLLKRIRELEIKTKGLVDGMMSGSYKSKIRGRGIEFSEVREYVLGDDVRHIDWNVTARTNKLHVKEFVEERDCVYMLFLTILQAMNLVFQKAKNQLVMKLQRQSYFLQ